MCSLRFRILVESTYIIRHNLNLSPRQIIFLALRHASNGWSSLDIVQLDDANKHDSLHTSQGDTVQQRTIKLRIVQLRIVHLDTVHLNIVYL